VDAVVGHDAIVAGLIVTDQERRIVGKKREAVDTEVSPGCLAHFLPVGLALPLMPSQFPSERAELTTPRPAPTTPQG
jgi:hypothetical protein